MSVRPLMLSVALLALLAACGGRAPEPKAPPATSTTSPNGEPLPFRAGADDCRGALSAWFNRADANGDGVLDAGEMQADAMRWFAQADLDHDGQITSDELAEVRRRLLPEPAPEPMDAGNGPGGSTGLGGGRGGPSGMGGGPGGAGGRGPSLPRSQAKVDPVMQADANADFRVTEQEFRAFVTAQFAERAHGGVLAQAQVLESCNKAAR